MRTTTRTLALAATLATASLSPTARGDAPVADDTIAQLRAQIAELDQKLRILERRQELAAEEAATRARATPVITAGQSGFILASPDERFSLRIRANVQADARFFFGDNGQANDTFLLRRIRPSFEGTVGGRFGFRIMPDFAPAATTLLDAYANYRHSDALVVQVGKFKSPFDLERLVSQTDLLFIERGYPTSLGPNRDLGLQVSGAVLGGRLDYAAGIFNGTVDNGSAVTDLDDNKELAARLFAQPWRGDDSALAGLGLGVAVTLGDKGGDTPAAYRTNAQQTFFGYRSGVVHRGAHVRVSPQLNYYNGPFGAFASWTLSEADVALGTTVATLSHTGWSVNVAYVLTGEDDSFRGVRPRRPFDIANGDWGAFQIAARWGELDIDDAAFPVFANPATSASRVLGGTLGLNWFLSRNVKAVLNYEYSTFSGGNAGTVTSDDEHAVLTRVQLSY